MREWKYHQDERDEAIGTGCLVILLFFIVLFLYAMAVLGSMLHG